MIFFHGHRATIKRDVLDRQRVADQISLSKANAVLVAPQFAVNASDSSAGNFWSPGLFTLFLNEASEQLAILHGFLGLARDFDKLNVIIVGYSGGFAPVAWAIHHGGSNERMRGVILLDALYGELDKFEKWIAGDRYRRFFVSGYLGSTRARNLQLQQLLDNRGIKYRMALDERHPSRQHHLPPRPQWREPPQLRHPRLDRQSAGRHPEPAAGIPALTRPDGQPRLIPMQPWSASGTPPRLP